MGSWRRGDAPDCNGHATDSAEGNIVLRRLPDCGLDALATALRARSAATPVASWLRDRGLTDAD